MGALSPTLLLLPDTDGALLLLLLLAVSVHDISLHV